MSGLQKRLALFGILVFAVAVLLFVGKSDNDNTLRARTDRIAGSFKCPTCQGLSVSQSKASTARAIYLEIERQVSEGRSDDEVRTYLVSRFGEQQLLRPETSGIGSLAWIAPVVVGTVALAALVRVFTRKREQAAEVSDDDRRSVAEALQELRGNTSETR